MFEYLFVSLYKLYLYPCLNVYSDLEWTLDALLWQQFQQSNYYKGFKGKQIRYCYDMNIL